MVRHLRHYLYIFFLFLITVGISLYISPSFANLDSLESPDGRYQAVLISSGGGVHYQVKEKSSGRIVLTTHAQYKEANDVKAGLFGPNSQTFAAAYHYGHKGNYTWIGVWTLDTEFLARSEEKPGFLKELSGIFRSPPSSAIKSPDGKYEARRVASGGSVHYELRERTTGRIVMVTRAQYNTPNDVKAGVFSSDSKEFAAAYHYGHKGNYTWVGIWTLSSGVLRGDLTKPGLLGNISTTVFSELPPKILVFERDPDKSRYAIGEQVTLKWDVQCSQSCEVTLFGGINGNLFKLKNQPKSGSKTVTGLLQDTAYRLIVRDGNHTIEETTSVRTKKSSSETKEFYFKIRCPSNFTPCYVMSQLGTSSSEAKKAVQRSAINCTVEEISQSDYWKGC